MVRAERENFMDQTREGKDRKLQKWLPKQRGKSLRFLMTMCTDTDTDTDSDTDTDTDACTLP